MKLRRGMMMMAVSALCGFAGCPDEPVGREQSPVGTQSVGGEDAESTQELRGGDAALAVDGGAPTDTGPVAPDADAGGPAEENPGKLGPHAVGHTQLTVADPEDAGRVLVTEIWYPAATFDLESVTVYVIGAMGAFELEYASQVAQRDVQAAQGPWPLVIFSHGYGGISTQSLDLCERLASHGFVVASTAHAGNTAEDDFNETSVPRDEAAADRPRDVRTLIDTLVGGEELPEQLVGLVDPEGIGVAGHSFGGYTALSAAAGHDGSEMPPDPRVKAIAPICPGSDDLNDEELAAVALPVLFVGGTEDASTPIDPHVTRPYALMSEAPRYRVDVVGATHTHFANICTIGQALIDMGVTQDLWESIGAGALLDLYDEVCGPEAFPIEQAIRIQCHYVVAFFKAYLAGEERWQGYLSPDYAEACEPDVVHFSDGVSLTADLPVCRSK